MEKDKSISLLDIQKDITHRQLKQKYKIGDRVNTSISCCLGGIVLDCSDNTFYYVETKYETTERYSTNRVVKTTIRWFTEFDLRPFNENNNKEFTRDRSWKDEIFINSNKKDIELFHDMKLRGYLNLNPDYQRDLVWSKKQKDDLIKSVFDLKNLGSLTIIRDSKMDYEVLDGKQRLSTLFDFMEDKFKYRGKLFSELNKADRNTIECYQLQYSQIDTVDDLTTQEKVELFIDFNTKGTRVSDSHISKLIEKYIQKGDKYES